jgi:hypothetical protein
MCDHGGRSLDQLSAEVAHHPVGKQVLGMDSASLGKQPLDRIFLIDGVSDCLHAAQCPEKIHCCGAGCSESLDVRRKASLPVSAMLHGGKHESISSSNANRRRSANNHCPDRFGCFTGVARFDEPLFARQYALIEQEQPVIVPDDRTIRIGSLVEHQSTHL